MSNWKLLQGDCLELMPEIPSGSIDAVVTDPPWPDCKVDTGWLGPEWWAEVAKEMERLVGTKGKIGIQLASHIDMRPFVRPLTLPFVHLNWLRYVPPGRNGNILVTADIVYWFGYGFLPKGKRNLPQMTVAASQKIHRENRRRLFHPTPRDLRHVDWLIRTQVGPGRTVLDPFMGSGTTGVACLKNDCNFVGMELVPEHFTEAKERIEGEAKGLNSLDRTMGQKALYE